MIKFFRHIRRALLGEGKFSKYLLYAIGEIVLVVIGILIALQINNANEIKSNEERLLGILQEIETDLYNDKVYSNELKIDLSGFVNGVYLVEIGVGERSTTKKIIIEN